MTDEAISPLRRRMIEDMTIRKLVPKTQEGYIRNVKAFAAFLGRSPGTASREDVRRFQLHLTSSGAGTPKINSTVTALRFFFDVTLDRPAARHRLHGGIEPWAILAAFSPRDAGILKCAHHGPSVALRDGFKLAALVAGGLL